MTTEAGAPGCGMVRTLGPGPVHPWRRTRRLTSTPAAIATAMTSKMTSHRAAPPAAAVSATVTAGETARAVSRAARPDRTEATKVDGPAALGAARPGPGR